jgi:hypothetical protein
MGDAPDSAPEDRTQARPEPLILPFSNGGERRLRRPREPSRFRDLRPEELAVLRVALGDTARKGQAFRRGMAAGLVVAPLVVLVLWWTLA